MIARRLAQAIPRIVLAALLPCLVSACMLARTGGPVSVLAPQVDAAAEADWPDIETSLVVSRPQSDQLRSSDRVLVRVAGSRLRSWPAAAWHDSMPDMVQTALIRAFEDSGKVRGVGRQGSLRATYNLMSDLRNFEVVDDGGADLAVEMSLQTTLVHHASGDVVATRLFNHEQRADGKDLDAVVAAFEQTLGTIVPAVVGWVLGQARDAEAGQD